MSELTKDMKQAFMMFPQEIADKLDKLPSLKLQKLEEIRLRSGQAVTVLIQGKEHGLSEMIADSRCFEHILSKATGQAVYSAQEMLKHCFLTLPGGHRLGICGSAVYRNGELFTVKEISSMNLRFAKAYAGVADRAADFLWTRPVSTLIIGPPGRGKTTLLRDLIRQLSSRFSWRISVADERMELAACYLGIPQFDVGEHTDVMSGVRKAEAIDILLRTMNPQWIAVDEITSEDDVRAMLQASYCGVSFLATAHAASRENLMSRPVYCELMKSGVFQNLLQITPNRQIVMERMGQGA